MSNTFAQPAAHPSPVIALNEGVPVRAFGNEILFKLSTEQTGGAFILGLANVPVGGGPPLHVHDSDDEMFIILEGQYKVCLNNNWTEASAGSVVFLPRGIPHTFKVVGDKPGKHWVVVTPGGFDQYYKRCAAVMTAPGKLSAEQVAEIETIGAGFGYHLVGI